MGSVQSGKTANMIGLATMAAHYDWNYIIILSGTIDNLRKQTRDRFMHDLLASGGVAWHILIKWKYQLHGRCTEREKNTCQITWS
mgnify:CR=1 FL=1